MRLGLFLIICIVLHSNGTVKGWLKQCAEYYTIICCSFAAEMNSKCAVNGTQVDFHCSNVDSWFLRYERYDAYSDTLTVDAIIDTDDTDYTIGGYQIFDILCYSTENGYTDASLIITGKLLPPVTTNYRQ